MLNVDPRGFFYRFVAVLAGAVMIGLGLAPFLHRGDLWFGELVFAPLAVMFGIMIVAMALFKPEWLGTSPERRKRRSRS